MKLTESILKQLIREEIEAVEEQQAMNEAKLPAFNLSATPNRMEKTDYGNPGTNLLAKQTSRELIGLYEYINAILQYLRNREGV